MSPSGFGNHWPESGRFSALLLLMAALLLLEQQVGLHRLDLQVRPFSLLPLLIGVAWLRPRQELLLGATFLASTVVAVRPPSALLASEFLLRSCGRGLIVAFCVWLSHLRQHWQRRAQRLNGAAVAHEMRQPLLLLQLGSRRLLRHLEQLPDPDPVCVACVDGIHDASEQLGRSMAAMVKLLHQGNVSTGRLNWQAVLCEALESERQHLLPLQVRLRAVGLDAPLWIQGDGEQLGIAAANLLRNACDALALVAPGQRQLLVRLQRQRTRACFTVADSGPGLPQDLAGLQAHGSAKLGGMGLGLVIVQAIAEAHGGELLAGRSRALGGAELRLRLPSRR